jgi:uncharacterized protein
MSGAVRNLILTGGIGHPFADSAAALAGCLADAGYHSDVTEDIEAGLESLARSEHRLVTLYALRWTMMTGEKYAPYRAQWGFRLSPRGQAALESHVARGGGLLVLHTGLICFDDWPELRDITGGVWRWGVSSHPPRGPVHVAPTTIPHPVMAGVPAFDLAEDEAYQELDLLADVEPLATVRATAHNKGAWPAVWARGYKQGRVVCDTLGHDRRSLETPTHRRLLANAARWLSE